MVNVSIKHVHHSQLRGRSAINNWSLCSPWHSKYPEDQNWVIFMAFVFHNLSGEIMLIKYKVLFIIEVGVFKDHVMDQFTLFQCRHVTETLYRLWPSNKNKDFGNGTVNRKAQKTMVKFLCSNKEKIYMVIKSKFKKILYNRKIG